MSASKMMAAYCTYKVGCGILLMTGSEYDASRVLDASCKLSPDDCTEQPVLKVQCRETAPTSFGCQISRLLAGSWRSRQLCGQSEGICENV